MNQSIDFLSKIEEVEGLLEDDKFLLAQLHRNDVFRLIKNVEKDIQHKHKLLQELQEECVHVYIEQNRYLDYDRNCIQATCAVCGKDIDVGISQIPQFHIITIPNGFTQMSKIKEFTKNLIKAGLQADAIRNTVKEAFGE